MRKFVFILFLLMTISVSAQEIEPVDSLDEETGLIYHPDGTVSVDSLCADTIDFKKPPVPQIPIRECDCLVVVDPMFHYCVVYKNGLCGVYDIKKKRNVTRIEFPYLEYAYRKEMEGQYYTYLTWKIADGRTGIVGISEQTNEFVTIIFPKEDEDD